ncbi:hypothetical protein [Streptomyces asoensis]|uniref:Uncharacterized protein n=1 Tax=Streptomyces asoensis TaxID=249586 RepID=A0ABQ3RYZ7_9ACTN|nr:hypothetical protein [Streptomyces asoensis]GGQ48889.1 hypothetical protein GCM10010496_09010 [Streptomyces asoensis]GHI61093.1 hypothetical protein Saso_27430 [Streptomyces asoensis]GHI63056.1 hypothetical protein Saso_47060 [Streptomyces asoensis]
MAHDTGMGPTPGTPVTVSIVTVLPVPRQSGLEPEQVRGATCVWCRKQLTADAVDLGRRQGSYAGVYGPWYPRACDGCTQREADRVLKLHVTTCTRCSPPLPRYCPDGTALRALAMGDEA